MTKSPYFYLLIASILWGATVPIMKLTLTQFPLFSLAFIRMFVASLILFPFIYKRLKIEKTDYKLFLKAAFFGTNLNLTLFFLGLNYSNAINSAVISSAIPIFTIAISYIFFKEKLTQKLLIANAIAFIGIITIVGLPIFESNYKSLLGNIFLILATIAWIIHEISAKKLLKTYNAVIVTFYTTLIGAIIFLPGFLFDFISNPSWISEVQTNGLLGLIYGILFSSIVAYLFWNKGLSKLKTSEASFFFYLNPISAVVFSILILGEKLTLPLATGITLIAISVFLVETHRHSHPLHKNLA